MMKTIDAKFFILSPDRKSRDRIDSVISNEVCEIYSLENHEIVGDVLSQFDKSVLVLESSNINIKNQLNSFITGLIENYNKNIIKIIIVGTPDKILENEKFLYVELEDLISDENIYGIIEKLNIWGPRNYIRFGNKASRIAFFRMKIKNKWRTGVIHDISASGMSCSFDKHTDINIDENSTKIELCIKDKIFFLSGSFLIRRTFKNTNMFVLVFSRKRSNENIKNLNSIIFKLTRDYVEHKISKFV